MLLTINVGNTNTKFGVFRDSELATDWHIPTMKRTTDEYVMLLRDLFGHAGLNSEDFNGAAISNVIPEAEPALVDACRELFGADPYVVDPATETAIRIRYEPRSALGADRLVNAVAAHALYGGPAVVVDLGTATTFDAVSADGEYLGGAIAPGVGVSADALTGSAPRLPKVDLVSPPSPIGTTTETSLQSGIIYGFAGQVDGVVARFREELGIEAKVVATGGFAELIARESRTIQVVNRALTLEGLRILWERRQAGETGQ